MKKTGWISLTLVGVLAITGFTATEVVEYVQVARNDVSEKIRDSIPLDVEIDRMEVLLQKTDHQVSRQKYAVAKAHVALEDAEADLQRKQRWCQTVMSEMRTLRNLAASEKETVYVGCHSVPTTQVQRTLAYKLSSYKSSHVALEAQEAAVNEQREAFTRLTARFDEWNQQRELLSHRLEALRARNQAQKFATDTDADDSFDDTELARVKELANDIETRLRIAETHQALGGNALDDVIEAADNDTDSVLSEVDALLNLN